MTELMQCQTHGSMSVQGGSVTGGSLMAKLFHHFSVSMMLECKDTDIILKHVSVKLAVSDFLVNKLNMSLCERIKVDYSVT